MDQAAVAPALVEGDFDTIGRFVRLYADRMALRDWQFEIPHGQPAAGRIAEIHVHETRRYGQIKVISTFRALEPDDQRYALVHELVHPHLVEIDCLVRGLEGELGGRMFEHFYGTFDRALERTVDALASGFAAILPPFTWEH